MCRSHKVGLGPSSYLTESSDSCLCIKCRNLPICKCWQVNLAHVVGRVNAHLCASYLTSLCLCFLIHQMGTIIIIIILTRLSWTKVNLYVTFHRD